MDILDKIDEFIFKQKTNYKIGDKVFAIKGHWAHTYIGEIIGFDKSGNIEVMWTYKNYSTENPKNIKPFTKQLPKFKLGDKVKEKSNLAKVGSVFALKSPTTVEVLWNINKYEVVSVDSIKKLG
jgi:hypothetical protein